MNGKLNLATAADYLEKNRRQYAEKNIKKKFYRDFSETDLSIISELQEYMATCYLQIPPFVLKRMEDRGLIPDQLDLFDTEGEVKAERLSKLNSLDEYNTVKQAVELGLPFEFSNEGFQNPFSPYRIVWAYSHGGMTYFVKTSLPPVNDIVRVIDVWRKKGDIPIHPLSSQRDVFARGEDWNIYDIIEDMVNKLDRQEDDDE